MREFAYDIKLAAVVRVKARSSSEAKAFLATALDCVDLKFTFDAKDCRGRITEASLSVDDGEYPYLFEVDGISTESSEEEV